MKQIVISLVWLLFVAGCSTDHGDAENAATGSYVAKNGALLINAELSSGKCWRINNYANFQQIKIRNISVIKNQ